MGCNSHLFIEINPWKDSPKYWTPYALDLRESRDYGLYGFLAGVRGEGPAVAEPRGLPEDASEEVVAVFKQWGSDFHTPTWLTPSEFRRAVRGIEEARDKWSAEKQEVVEVIAFEWRMVRMILQALAYEYGDDRVRLIVAFDN